MSSEHKKLLNQVEVTEVVSIIVLVISVGLAVIAVWLLTIEYPYTRTLSTDCSDGNACTADYAVGSSPAHCERFPASIATSCTSACYSEGTSTHCDGAGACTADDWTACNGYCTTTNGNAYGTSCNVTALFPLLPYFQTPTSSLEEDGVTTVDWCFANQCIFITLQVAFEVDPTGFEGYWDSWAGGEGLDCLDMLDTDAGADLSCVKATEIRTDSDGFSSFFDGIIVGSDNLNYTGRFCVFQYTCARFNTSAFSDEQNLAPTSISVNKNPRVPRSSAQPSKRAIATNSLSALSHQVALHAIMPGLKSKERELVKRHVMPRLVPS